MAVYLLKSLLSASQPLDITIVEASDTAGCGMPYRKGINADFMLCNASSREIPELTSSFHEWLVNRPARKLSEWGLSPQDLSIHAFYPRVLFGEYLQSEFERLCVHARAAGHAVNVLTGCQVVDIIPGSCEATVKAEPGGDALDLRFDIVVITTGHRRPNQRNLHGVRMVPAWPFSYITELPPVQIGILGSSLSAVDVITALGHAHGEFIKQGDSIAWQAHADAKSLQITMVSRTGVMPEADFYCPYPYRPLRHLTDDSVRAEVKMGTYRLLDRIFALLLRELAATDPKYLRDMGSQTRTIAGFAQSYFSRRRRSGGLAAARQGLAEALASMRREETIAYRYALLCAHEKFDLALRHLDRADWAQFTKYLLPVFADSYATVPHQSFAQVLAMDSAGVLDLKASGQDVDLRPASDGGVEVLLENSAMRFDVMIDARGQLPARVNELPFPSLAAALADKSAPLEAPFRLSLTDPDAAPVYCLAMPQLLDRYPFSQALASCADLANIAATDIGVACSAARPWQGVQWAGQTSVIAHSPLLQQQTTEPSPNGLLRGPIGLS